MIRPALLIMLLAFSLDSWTPAQNRAPAFAGKWLIVKVISPKEGQLPKETWEITFDDKTMTRRIFYKQSEKNPTFVFNLDGTDVSREVPDCYGRKEILKLKRIQSNEIEVTERGPGCGSSGSGGMLITEVWKLASDGSTLTADKEFRSADPKIQIRSFNNKYLLQRVTSTTQN